MSHTKLRPFIVKVSVLGYFPLYSPTPCLPSHSIIPSYRTAFVGRPIAHAQMQSINQKNKIGANA